MPKLFGREPALWLAFVGSLISVLSAFVLHLSVDAEGAVNGVVAALMGLIVWAVTKDGGPALILGFAKSIFIMLAAFHFNLAADRQALLMTLLSAAVAMFVRTQVAAPAPPPVETAIPVVTVNKVVE